jgi:endonuclease YncB( thermonuclease family)
MSYFTTITEDWEEAENEEMVRDGYAVLYTFSPNVKHVAELRAAQELARSEGRGIWDSNGLQELPLSTAGNIGEGELF